MHQSPKRRYDVCGSLLAPSKITLLSRLSRPVMRHGRMSLKYSAHARKSVPRLIIPAIRNESLFFCGRINPLH